MARKKLKGHLPPDFHLEESTPLTDLGLSSLQMAEVVFELEEQIGIEFDPSQAADVKTVGQLIELANQLVES
jgi:acyl carrier protein